MKKTVIIGSNPKTNNYAFMAAERLKNYGHEFIPIGISEGQVLGKSILNIRDEPKIDEVDTVTLYINPQRQIEWYSYILSLKPKRIIFNPGTENQELKKLAEAQGIICEEACTLVMLSVGNF
ncbi:CoA-binding protein [Roseivirga seohaensis subsp. aquiponti]|uniref:CoA-binding protein n=1 Tax=Roseivirga seohaensis subsp. aquiponti TaxID=1566026 RepID=A0A0L8AQ38_9BACT|nr:CoA-binding protein [Roseivirga seohaensis]KOF04361.1 CoA-binding protein [Roseivirga seohaensis subsp. aquiponti]